MDKYKLIWSDRAFYDLEDAFELLSKKSIEAASNTIEQLLIKADQLIKLPKSGPVELRLKNRKEEYRYLVKGHHKIIYRIQGLSVIIVTPLFDMFRRACRAIDFRDL